MRRPSGINLHICPIQYVAKRLALKLNEYDSIKFSFKSISKAVGLSDQPLFRFFNYPDKNIYTLYNKHFTKQNNSCTCKMESKLSSLNNVWCWQRLKTAGRHSVTATGIRVTAHAPATVSRNSTLVIWNGTVVTNVSVFNRLLCSPFIECVRSYLILYFYMDDIHYSYSAHSFFYWSIINSSGS